MSDPVVPVVPVVPPKPWYMSKTILVNLMMGIGMIVGQFYPPVQAMIQEYLGEAGTAWALINIILRLISKDKVSIS
jgi:hypothetical protein